jgi:hypothetical protein
LKAPISHSTRTTANNIANDFFAGLADLQCDIDALGCPSNNANN